MQEGVHELAVWINLSVVVAKVLAIDLLAQRLVAVLCPQYGRTYQLEPELGALSSVNDN